MLLRDDPFEIEALNKFDYALIVIRRAEYLLEHGARREAVSGYLQRNYNRLAT